MDAIVKSLPDIIKAAAQSYLGILALLVCAVALLAYVFFAKASEKMRLIVFVLMFVGVVGFVVAMFVAAPPGPSGQQAGSAASGPTSGSNRPSMSAEARRLLIGAASDPQGLVLYEKFGAGVDLHTNGESLLTDKADHRAVASWEAGLQELVDAGLLEARGERGEVYEITRKGYEAAARATP